MPDGPITVDVSYEKSNYFRVIHADGIFGGLTPSGGVQVAFFSQRSPLPKKSTLTMNPADKTVVEAVTETKTGLFRELEASIVMDMNVSLALHFWLTQQLANLRKQLSVSDQDWKKHMDSVDAAAAS